MTAIFLSVAHFCSLGKFWGCLAVLSRQPLVLYREFYLNNRNVDQTVI
jgi:hypothetical protein